MKELAAIFKGTDINPFMRSVSTSTNCSKAI
jgi:hypothetical protein